MDCVLAGLTGLIFLYVSLYDILVGLVILDAGLKVKGRKCKFACKKLQFLGHIVSQEGIQPDTEKVTAVQDSPAP